MSRISQIAGDLAGADGAVVDQIGLGAVRRGQRDGANRALGRIGVPLRLRRHGALRVEAQRRGLRADELHADVVSSDTWLLSALMTRTSISLESWSM